MPEILDQGYLALPSTEKRVPAIMVIPAWWGLNDFFKQLCGRLAQAGFVTFAPDLYSGQVAETVDSAAALRDGLDDIKTEILVRGAVEALRQHSLSNGQPIGLIGFSLGAFHALALLAEIPEQIGALVIFYGTYDTVYPNIQAAVLGHFAEIDEFEPLAEQQKLKTALKAVGANTTFYTYPGTEHWFFETDQPKAYKADAAELAWERTISFLKDHLVPGG